MILEKGDLQVGNLERESEFESLKNQVANITSVMWVNKDTNVPFPVPIILKAMDDINFSINESQNAKKQALDLIRLLPEVLPIERAKMRIKITCAQSENVEQVKQVLTEKYDKEDETKSQQYTLEREFNVETSGDSGSGKTELIYLIMPHLIKDIMSMWNKNDDLNFEIIDHHVYSRLVTQEEEEKAQKMYNDTAEEKKMKAEEEFNKPIIITNKEENKSGPVLKAAEASENAIKCTTWNGAVFETKEEFKTHYKSEWHIENAKRKMTGQQKLSLDEFQIWREEEIDKEMFEEQNRNKGKGKKKNKKNKKR